MKSSSGGSGGERPYSTRSRSGAASAATRGLAAAAVASTPTASGRTRAGIPQTAPVSIVDRAASTSASAAAGIKDDVAARRRKSTRTHDLTPPPSPPVAENLAPSSIEWLTPLMATLVCKLEQAEQPLCVHSLASSLDAAMLRSLNSSGSTASTIVKNEIATYLRAVAAEDNEIERLDGGADGSSLRRTAYRYRASASGARLRARVLREHAARQRRSSQSIPAGSSGSAVVPAKRKGSVSIASAGDADTRKQASASMAEENNKRRRERDRERRRRQNSSRAAGIFSGIDETVLRIAEEEVQREQYRTPSPHLSGGSDRATTPEYSSGVEHGSPASSNSSGSWRQGQGPFKYDMSYIGSRRNGGDLEAEVFGSQKNYFFGMDDEREDRVDSTLTPASVSVSPDLSPRVEASAAGEVPAADSDCDMHGEQVEVKRVGTSPKQTANKAVDLPASPGESRESGIPQQSQVKPEDLPLPWEPISDISDDDGDEGDSADREDSKSASAVPEARIVEGGLLSPDGAVVDGDDEYGFWRMDMMDEEEEPEGPATEKDKGDSGFARMAVAARVRAVPTLSVQVRSKYFSRVEQFVQSPEGLGQDELDEMLAAI